MKNLSVDNLVELMIECEKENPIDFFDLPVDEKHCRYLVASHALELFSLINDPREREIGLLIAMSNQVLQNQFLYMKMMDVVNKFNKVQLHKCPFCGNDMNQQYMDSPEETIYPMNRDRTYWNIICQEYSGGCGAIVIADSKEECIEKWNKRK